MICSPSGRVLLIKLDIDLVLTRVPTRIPVDNKTCSDTCLVIELSILSPVLTTSSVSKLTDILFNPRNRHRHVIIYKVSFLNSN